jgi:hypothetical protein
MHTALAVDMRDAEHTVAQLAVTQAEHVATQAARLAVVMPVAARLVVDLVAAAVHAAAPVAVATVVAAVDTGNLGVSAA